KEEDEEDIWEEDDGKVGSDPVKKVAPLPRVQNGEGSSSEANRSTLESLQQGVQVRRSGDPLRDKLISEAPVMNWGSQLSNWDSTTEVNSRLRANHRGIEVESHWGRVDQDAVIPADKIAALNLQASVYREERTEIPPCHAPLKKGGLCQRRDLRACPFHGPIVPRDDEENPIIKESSLEESQNQTSSSTTRISQEDDTPMDGTVSDSDPNQLARQKAKQALKNIREKDREELKKIAKRAKHAKQLPQGNDDEKYRETSANQW
ncbi:BnaAnng32850D, partial [Brassica napus]